MSASRASHDRVAAAADRTATAQVDAALDRLHLSGAIFLRGEYTEGWSYTSLPAGDAAAILAPGAPRVILFHVVAAGRCWIEVDGGERLWAGPGDVIVLPYGDAHRMGGADEGTCVPIADLIDPPPWTRMPVIRHGNGGRTTSVVCGWLRCEDPLFDRRLRVFPPVFVVSPPDGPAGDWVRASIEYAAGLTAVAPDGRIEAPPRLPELLFIEVLRLYVADFPAEPMGWLAALSDPVLAPVLAAVHADPDRKWDLVTLARRANVSVSLLDQRFRSVLGMAPIRYMTAWRMHLAEDLLRSTDLTVSAVARRVGYESDEAFSRAFKRALGTAPSSWRSRTA
ncbi:AraC family transcriptional regulator [Georgenia halophila]|uniref:AraC family transcriptional regulator n=1 Tax=Georgenia halophila TaxID=620889 RepID=A0ABP8L0E7_9MICO